MPVTVSAPVALSLSEGEQSFSYGLHRLPNGNFVVAYDDTSNTRAIYAQIFAPDGTTVGDRVLVATPAADFANRSGGGRAQGQL